MVRYSNIITVVGPIIWLLQGASAVAQTPPVIKPPPVTPPGEEKTEKTIVLNPTLEDCNRGWSSELKWSKDQFDAYCQRLKSSK